MGWRGLAIAATACALPALGAASATAAPPRELTVQAHPSRLARAGTTTISGRLIAPAAPLAGRLLELQLDPRPFGRLVNVAHTLTAADGSYRFAAVRVERDTRVRVVAVGQPGVVADVEVHVRPPVYPSRGRVRAAARFLARRAGRTAFAVVADDGRLEGKNDRSRFHSASVVKSMLLVAYLRKLAGEHRALDSTSRGLLYPMIHSSDNDAASGVLASVGEAALNRVARDARMRDYVPGGGTWGFTQISAADLAGFFFRADPATLPRLRALAAVGHRSERELGDTGGRAPGVQRLLQGRLAA
jgi:hypothetical protein